MQTTAHAAVGMNIDRIWVSTGLGGKVFGSELHSQRLRRMRIDSIAL